MQATELINRIRYRHPLTVLDVRSGSEFRSGHIQGAQHAPNWRILSRLVALPEDKTAQLVVTCEQGARARLAKSLLGLWGYRNVHLLDGHMEKWRRAGLALEK